MNAREFVAYRQKQFTNGALVFGLALFGLFLVTVL
jgi:hypothetical protein